MLVSVAAIFTFLLLGVVSARPSTYSQWAADSAIARHQGNGFNAKNQTTASYEAGELQWALRLLFERTGEQKYLDYIKLGLENIIAPNGTIIATDYSLADYTLDPLRLGPSFLYLYELTKDKKYKTSLDQLRLQLNIQGRTAQGQFWHKKRYAQQGWLDGIYMGEIFYAGHTRRFAPNNQTAWDDIALQFKLMWENTIQENATEGQTNTHLLYHGYDYSHTQVWASPDRGHSPEVWIRAVGWYSMALVDILPIFPKDHPGHKLILDQLHALLPHIVDAADPETGVWWLVMTWPGRDKNYFESSGTAMFIYSLLRAVRLGFVEDTDGKLVATAKKAYDYVTKNWVVDNGDGTMNWLNTVVVGSLDQDGSFDYYVKQAINLNDLKGLSAFALASYEIEELSK